MKTLLKVILLLGVLLGLLSWSQREHLGAFAHILPSYAAKEYCSCRYVMQRSMSDCQAYVRQWLPLQRLLDEPQARRVVAYGLGQRHAAQWRGPREGCRLDAWSAE